MPTFTLSSQPTRPRRDPAVFPPQAGIDYGMVALTHWLDAQIFACDVERLSSLIATGEAWQSAHGDDHPRALDAALQLRKARLSKWRAEQVSWFHVCATYAALQHIDREAWASEHAPALDTNHPNAIWRHLLPGVAPGPWPWPKNGLLEGGETWNIPDQRELLKLRKAMA